MNGDVEAKLDSLENTIKNISLENNDSENISNKISKKSKIRKKNKSIDKNKRRDKSKNKKRSEVEIK